MPNIWPVAQNWPAMVFNPTRLIHFENKKIHKHLYIILNYCSSLGYFVK